MDSKKSVRMKDDYRLIALIAMISTVLMTPLYLFESYNKIELFFTIVYFFLVLMSLMIAIIVLNQDKDRLIDRLNKKQK